MSDKGKEKEKDLPAVAASTALAIADFGDDAGKGLENITDDERKIPFLRIIQSNSPELEEGNARFLPAAKAGMFVNTASRQLYAKLTMIPCARAHKFIEYIPREAGSGFVGIHDPKSDLIGMLRAKQGKFGKLSRDVTRRNAEGKALDGTEIVESFEIYAILIDPATGQKFRAVVPFQSTQISKYQNLVERADGFQYMDSIKQVPVTPPFWAHRWAMTTAVEKNKKGTFRGYLIGLEGKLPDGSDDLPIKSLVKRSDPLYAEGKAFSEFVEAGKADVDYNNAPPEDAAKSEGEIEM